MERPEDFLVKLSRIPFERPSPGDRSLDKDKVEKYLTQLDNIWNMFGFPDIPILIKSIIANTIYIPFDTFWENFIASVNMFKLYIGDCPFYVLVDGSKIGSETWLMQGIAKQILDMKGYKGFLKSTETYDEEVYSTEIFVTFDDCIYTGIHTYDDVFGKFANNARSVGYDVKDMIAVAVTPYYSLDGTGSCSDALSDAGYKEFKHFGIGRIDPIEISESDPPTIDKPQLLPFDFQFPIIYPIYFDHKVAGTSSSFPSIYLEGTVHGGLKVGSLLKMETDRSPIDRLKNVL
jgi:hypothetical protein